MASFDLSEVGSESQNLRLLEGRFRRADRENPPNSRLHFLRFPLQGFLCLLLGRICPSYIFRFMKILLASIAYLEPS